jgi:hypothetical protein
MFLLALTEQRLSLGVENANRFKYGLNKLKEKTVIMNY